VAFAQAGGLQDPREGQLASVALSLRLALVGLGHVHEAAGEEGGKVMAELLAGVSLSIALGASYGNSRESMRPSTRRLPI